MDVIKHPKEEIVPQISLSELAAALEDVMETTGDEPAPSSPEVDFRLNQLLHN